MEIPAPHTARETAAIFFPLHAMHTVLQCDVTSETISMLCDCGPPLLRITAKDVKSLGLTREQVKYGLRNVLPLTTVKQAKARSEGEPK